MGSEQYHGAHHLPGFLPRLQAASPAAMACSTFGTSNCRSAFPRHGDLTGQELPNANSHDDTMGLITCLTFSEAPSC